MTSWDDAGCFFCALGYGYAQWAIAITFRRAVFRQGSYEKEWWLNNNADFKLIKDIQENQLRILEELKYVIDEISQITIGNKKAKENRKQL